MSWFSYPLSNRITAAAPNTKLRLAWLVQLCLLPVALIGPNTGLALYACFVLGTGVALLWRPGEPPILLLIFFVQWLQAAVGLFYGNLRGQSIGSLAEVDGNQQLAVFLLLTGLLVLASAIRLAAGPPVRGLLQSIRIFVAARPLNFWVRVFIGAWVFSALCTSAAWASGGLRQVFLSLADIKWVGFMLLTFASFAIPNRPKLPWLIAFGSQFALSIGGFFSNFKDVFFYALIGLVASNVRFRFRVVLPIALLASVLIFLGLVWTAIKGEYRTFVNRGNGQQVVLVSYSERIAEIGNLVSDLRTQDLPIAADLMMKRLMYFQYFGVVLDRVPNALPYADGQIWGDAVLRPFMPRLLFPNKSAVNDSDLTNRYTGLRVATASQGTSISMGYVTEAFIDFGPTFMFLPIAGFGIFLGIFYRLLLSRLGLSAALGAALAPFAFMPALFSETSSLKLVPAMGLSVISCWLILTFLAPRVFGLPKRMRRRRSLLPMRSQRA